MSYCPKCGVKIPEEGKFCPNCGVSTRKPLSRPASTSPSKPKVGDPLGAVSAGVFFILVAFTWIKYPTLAADVPAYFESFGVYGHPVMLPSSLYEPLILFSTIFGVWHFILTGLRLVFRQNLKEAASNIGGGVFFLYLAYLLRQYSIGSIAENSLLPLLVIGIGMAIAVGGFSLLLIHRITRK